MTRAPWTDEDFDLIVRGILERHTPRQIAEELASRCGCTFDYRLPDDAGPVTECEYHRALRELTTRPG